ncbi:MAG TPA: hypothetical protein VMZ52_03595 [Bryobacteraceae bacterium]|nr:hypothetical protein [Bryobacteraceae bacterium]
MPHRAHYLQSRIESARSRIRILSTLRNLAALPKAGDLTDRQWRGINLQFAGRQTNLMERLAAAEQRLLPHIYQRAVQRQLNAALGQLELDLSQALVIFDTYMDVLTQRHPGPLGAMLAGCDIVAKDALRRDHPSLLAVEDPLVYCDRGFGASTLREGVVFPGGARNPMPLIQIPYSRLLEKYNLTSILHEVGHEAMARLGLRTELPKVFRATVSKAGGSSAIADLFSLWSSEIGPDFWGFCCSGLAAAGTIQEFLALPPAHVFRVLWTDPHPPPYIRALLAFRLCRDVWGRGPWDEWQSTWLGNYPIDQAPADSKPTLRQAQRVIPAISEALLSHKFDTTGGRPIPSMFNLGVLNPGSLAGRINGSSIRLRGLRPAAHLAVFRVLREQRNIAEPALDRLMTQWLLTLGKRKAAAPK